MIEAEITPLSWLCSLIDVSAGMKAGSMKVVYQDDRCIQVLIKETGEVWEFAPEVVRDAVCGREPGKPDRRGDSRRQDDRTKKWIGEANPDIKVTLK